MKYLYLIITLLFFVPLKGQESPLELKLNYLWEEAYKEFTKKEYQASKKLYGEFVELSVDNDSLSFVIYGKMYIAKILFREYKLEEFERCLDETEKYGLQHNIFKEYPDLDGDLNFWKAQLYSTEKRHKKAIIYFEKALKRVEEGEVLMASKFELYNNLGIAFQELGDYERSIYYFEKSDRERKSKDAVTINKTNMAYSLLEEERTTEAISYFEEAYKAFKKDKERKISENSWATILHNFAYACTQKKDYERAILLLKDAKKLKMLPVNQAKNAQELGNVYLGLNQFEKADSLLQLALNKRFQIFGNKNQQVGSTLRQIGKGYASQNKHQIALSYYQRALTHLVYDFADSTDYSTNPSLDKVNSKIYLFKTLSQKADSQEALQQYDNALNSLKKADSLLDIIRTEDLFFENSKYSWLKKSKKIYEQAISLALKVNQPELAFQFSQKSHGLLLREGIQELQSKLNGLLPDTIIQKEQNLKFKIADLSLNLFKADAKNKDSIEADLFKANQNLDLLQRSIAEEFPVYAQRKQELSSSDISSIQRELKSTSDALIEYFVGEKRIHYFVITKEDFNVYSKAKPENFLELIDNNLNVLCTNDGTAEGFQKYTKSAYQLYELLMKDVIEKEPKIKNFNIIPDEELGYIPFAVLLSEPSHYTGRYELLSYLAKDYDFSYNYSSALFIELKQQNNTENTKPFVGFAPSFSGSPTSSRGEKSLDSLIHNKDEVLLINSILNGKVYTDTAATAQSYLNNLEEYKVVHLATHATCNDLNPLKSHLSFYDKEITALEIYNLDLNTELAVLSACQTGAGKLRKGEGIMSLARSFMYAGCPSVITSLWQVNDERTAGLMKKFYKNLYAGQDKNKALCEAQREYLNEEYTTALSHPYYWATFIQIGNSTPVWEASFALWKKSLLAIVLIVILFFLVKNKI